MAINADKLSYALAKQVPDMAHGFTIHTSYGDIDIEASDALEFAVLADKLLTKQYIAATQKEKQL